MADQQQQQPPEHHTQQQQQSVAGWAHMVQQQQQHPGMMHPAQAAMMMQQHQQFMQFSNAHFQQQQQRSGMMNNPADMAGAGRAAVFPSHPMAFPNHPPPQMFMPGGPAFHGFLPQTPFFPPAFPPIPSHQQQQQGPEESTMMTEERTGSNINATTPTLQPPSHLYNGPPVSALVPRVPRGGGLQPSPPNHLYHHSNNSRSSFGSMVLVPTPPNAASTPAAENKEFFATNDDDHDVSPPPSPPEAATKQIASPTAAVVQRREDAKTSSPSSDPQQRSPLASLASNNPPPLSMFDPAEKPTKALQEASLLLGLRQRSPTVVQAESSPPQSPPKAAPTKTAEESKESSPVEDSNEEKDAPSEAAVLPTDDSVAPMKVPKNYPKRLALPEDHLKLNALHCFLRQNLLEIFVVERSNTKVKFRHNPSSSAGRVGLRCVFCAAARRNHPNENFDNTEAPMAIFYPKSTAEIYRLVTSWQRCHLRKCKQLPPRLRAQWELLKHDKARGKTQYWVVAAHAIGLRDRKTKAGGIHFAVDDNGMCCQQAES